MEPESRPAPPRWLDGLEDAALRAMPPPVSLYVRSGSYGEASVSEAVRAWQSVRFRTRVLRGGGEPDLATSPAGHRGVLAARRGAHRDAACGAPGR